MTLSSLSEPIDVVVYQKTGKKIPALVLINRKQPGAQNYDEDEPTQWVQDGLQKLPMLSRCREKDNSCDEGDRNRDRALC